MPENNRVSIIIPTYNHWELTHQLLYDIFTFCKNDIQDVVVVDNGSTDSQVVGGCVWWRDNGLLPFRVVKIKDNRGFIGAVNLGMDMTENHIRIVISNDVRVRSRFVPKVVEILTANPKSLVGGILRDYDTGWNKFGNRLFPYIEGWLLAMTGEAWDDLDGLDTRFMPNDYEDVDLSTTAISKGYELISLNDTGLIHTGGQTIGYNEKRLAITNANRVKFEEKWIKSK